MSPDHAAVPAELVSAVLAPGVMCSIVLTANQAKATGTTQRLPPLWSLVLGERLIYRHGEPEREREIAQALSKKIKAEPPAMLRRS